MIPEDKGLLSLLWIHALFDFLFCEERQEVRRSHRMLFNWLANISPDQWEIKFVNAYGPAFAMKDIDGSAIMLWRDEHGVLPNRIKACATYLQGTDFYMRGALSDYYNAPDSDPNEPQECGYVDWLYARLRRELYTKDRQLKAVQSALAT